MKPVTIRLYGELNDFVPTARRHLTFSHECPDRSSVKDLLEGVGVPHTEIDLLLINGESAAFSRRVEPGDRISAYPRSRSIDVSPVTQVRADPPDPIRFALDGHLGRLTRHLRLTGFDAWYHNQVTDVQLVAISNRENRILLTRDRELLKRSAVTLGYCVRSTAPRRQLVEVLDRFGLVPLIRPFRRCLDCNGELQAIRKAEVVHRLEPRTRVHYDDFHQCRGCGRLYWQGSHFDRLRRFVDQVTEEASTG